jgi:hypothetical protein
MSFSTLNAAGLLLGASGQQRVSLTSSADNVLKVSGTTSSTLAKLRGVDQPADDTDATSRSYVQTYVQQALRGLQTKLAVRLASTVPVNLSGGSLEQSSQVLRWPSASPGTSLLTTPDSAGRTIQPYLYRASSTSSWTVGCIWTPPANFTYDQWHDDMSLSFAFGPNYDNRRSSYTSVGPKSPAPDTRIYFYNTVTSKPTYYNQSDFPLGQPIYLLTTFDGQTQTATQTIARFINGSFVLPTPLTNSNPTTRTVAEGLSNGEVGDALVQFEASYTDFTNVVLASKVLTLQETFGPAPASWTTTGIDGVVPSASDRILLAGQTNAVQNGLWQVSSDGTQLERPADFSEGSDARSAYVFVSGGESNDDKGFLCTNDSATIVGTDAQTWQVYTASGGLGGLSVNGNTISTSAANVAFANPVAVGTLTASSGSIVDSSGTISMGSTNVSTSGTVTATSYNSPSDARLKYGSVPLATTWTDANGTQRSLYDLNPVAFNWTFNGDQDFGMIAQDVEALLRSYVQPAVPAQGELGAVPAEPKPLRATGTDGTADVHLTVNYGKLSVLCYAMCKDLKNLITGGGGSGVQTELNALIGAVGEQNGTGPDPASLDGNPLTLWGLTKFLYVRLYQLETYIQALASQITPPSPPLAAGAGFGTTTSDANLPTLPGAIGPSYLHPMTPWQS